LNAVRSCQPAGNRAFPSEDETHALVDEVVAFVHRVIEPLESSYARLLSNPRNMYNEDGVPVPEYKEARRRARMASAEAGYYALFAPKSLGGGETGAVAMFLIWEALYREFGPGRPLVDDVVGGWNRGPSEIISLFSPSLQHRISPRLMTGAEIFCFGLSEPDTGSDAWSMSTHAERESGGWRINGTKKWISDAPYADYVLVFAVTDAQEREAHRGGISAFLVPMSLDGVHVSEAIAIFGEIGGIRAVVELDDVHVADEFMVGKPGEALPTAQAGVSLGRLANAGRAVGMSRWALRLAAEYAGNRKTFGQPISAHQAIQFMIADSMIEAYAAYSMALDCARKIDLGDSSPKRLAMVKTFACERGFEILDRCMQVHGGVGFVNETRLYAGWHQLRVLRVADGSSEILRRLVARQVLRGDDSF